LLTPNQKAYRRKRARLGQPKLREIWRKQKAAQRGQAEAVLDQIVKRGRALDEAVAKFPASDKDQIVKRGRKLDEAVAKFTLAEKEK
jgi:prolyl oligopeptidase PreP (S9A serine peptidase family)